MLDKVIMGCDALVDFLPHQKKLTIDEKYELLKYAVGKGINTFDVSVCPNFIAAFKKLKATSDQEIIGIGNPNWKCGFKLGKEELWDIQDRIKVTLLENYFTPKERSAIFNLPDWAQKRWFLPNQEATALSPEEIRCIYLDKTQLINNLKLIKNEVDCVVFGSNYLEWLIKLDRLELILEALEIIKEMGFKVWSISHWPSVVAPVLNSLPFDGHWIHFNEIEQLIVPEDAIKYILKLNKPITVFRVLSAGKLSHKFEEAVQHVIQTLDPTNIVIGMSCQEDIDKFSCANIAEAPSLTIKLC